MNQLNLEQSEEKLLTLLKHLILQLMPNNITIVQTLMECPLKMMEVVDLWDLIGKELLFRMKLCALKLSQLMLVN